MGGDIIDAPSGKLDMVPPYPLGIVEEEENDARTFCGLLPVPEPEPDKCGDKGADPGPGVGVARPERVAGVDVEG